MQVTKIFLFILKYMLFVSFCRRTRVMENHRPHLVSITGAIGWHHRPPPSARSRPHDWKSRERDAGFARDPVPTSVAMRTRTTCFHPLVPGQRDTWWMACFGTRPEHGREKWPARKWARGTAALDLIKLKYGGESSDRTGYSRLPEFGGL